MNFAPQPPDFQAGYSHGWRRRTLHTLVLSSLLLLSACTAPRSLEPVSSRPFQFESDTFAYANELVWEYFYDENGEWQHRRNAEEPDYTHHCFVVTRSARQFFQHAHFDPSLPRVEDAAYRELVEKTTSRDPADNLPESERVVIPGYKNLRTFSEAREQLLKETCGGAWQSYFQRGHWRMVMPFSRGGQETEAEALAASIRNNRPPIVHVVTFPRILINHALLLYDVEDEGKTIRFTAYDPNQPEAPATLTYDRTTRRFQLPANDYWRGGELNVYEIYRAWNY